MKPTSFKQSNITFGVNQPEYFNLPAHRTYEGEATTVWRMSWWNRLVVLFTGKVIVRQLTFGKPLQPLAVYGSYDLSTLTNPDSYFEGDSLAFGEQGKYYKWTNNEPYDPFEFDFIEVSKEEYDYYQIYNGHEK